MLTLYLVRHAKSDRDNLQLYDMDRPLNDRGYRDASMLSKLLIEKNIVPERIVSSPAIRAFSTSLIFSRNLGYKVNAIVLHYELYETGVKDYVSVIKNSPDNISSLMIFGHNPTITELANKLSASFIEDMPTCAIVGIQFKTNSWKNIMDVPGELFFFDFPKNHYS